jgi:hypothetical protein
MAPFYREQGIGIMDQSAALVADNYSPVLRVLFSNAGKRIIGN